MFADKVSGNQIGIWLLAPEHLRLGTWDLLLGWTGQPTPQAEPRLALHVVNEAANATLLKPHYEGLPQKLKQQGLNPCIPWLYNFKLDFRFAWPSRRINHCLIISA